MFLGGWQLWINNFCHLTNILAKMFAFCGQKLYFFGKNPKKFCQKVKKGVSKIIWT